MCWTQINFLFFGIYCLAFVKDCLIGMLYVLTAETFHIVGDCLVVEIKKHPTTASSAVQS